jgi:ATP-binding cassette, subfamily B, bacterial
MSYDTGVLLALIAGAYVAVALSGQALAVAAAYGATQLARHHEPLQVLKIRGLSATHPATGRGVSDIDLTLERGSFTVISGPVGAGKTTLLRALLGLMPAEGGTVTWNGHPVTELAAFMSPPRTAYLPQVPRLFSESLADNVLLGSEPEAVDLDGALRTAVLETDLRGMPDGLATRLGARGVRLSGGRRNGSRPPAR